LIGFILSIVIFTRYITECRILSMILTCISWLAIAGKGEMMQLYFRYLSVLLKSQMQYKLSFVLLSFGQMFLAMNMFLGIYFLFARFHSVDGFSYSEVLLCLSVILMGFSLAEVVFRGFDTFSSIISNGEFDRILVRPRGAVYQVLCAKFELTRIGKLLPALVILVYAMAAGGVEWSAMKVLTLALMVMGCVTVFSCLFLVYAAFCFFTLEGLEFMNIFTDGGRELGQYPISIYGKGVLRFFTFVIPMAPAQYYPLLYLLGRTDSLLNALSPLFCFLFILPCYAFWRFGLRHYKSTGS